MSEDCWGVARVARTGPWLVAGTVWLAALLVAPVIDVVGRDHRLVPGLAVVALAVFTAAPVLAAIRRPGSLPGVLPLSLAVLTVLAVATGAAFGEPWWNAWILLAVVSGGIPTARGAWAVLLVPTAAAATLAVTGATPAQVWTVALTTFLAAAVNLVLVRLLRTVDALRAARTELARRAVTEERERFSRDLHDLLGHSLSVIVVKAEAVRRLTAREPEAALQHTRDIETIGRQALVEVRDAVDGYRRPSLARELAGGRAALEAAGVEADLPDTLPPLRAPVDETLAWVLREGVTNLVRHSGARACRLRVEADEDSVRLDLVDDGAGAPRADVLAGDRGLAGLARRVASAGGRLETSTGPGFRLVATLPRGSGPAPRGPLEPIGAEPS